MEDIMHLEYIKNLVLRHCKLPRTFEFISKNLSGLDPVQSNEALKDFKKDDLLKENNDLWSATEKNKLPTFHFHHEDPQLY